MKYETVIVGGGAAGLYCAASKTVSGGLIMEKTSIPGQKILISGSGQCNITHGGSIKDFIHHYGEHGSSIRSALYRHNNLAVMDFFAGLGVETFERQDGKIFPKSMRAKDVRDALLSKSKANGYELRTGCSLSSLQLLDDDTFLLNGSIQAEKVILAFGGASYPGTGSDGKTFDLLTQMGINVMQRVPALVPVFVQNYPYSSLAGIALAVSVKVGGHTCREDVLFTHKNLSGPGILNLSRYAKIGEKIVLNYHPDPLPAFHIQGNKKQIDVYFAEVLGLPKRLLGALLQRIGIEKERKVATLNKIEINTLKKGVTEDTFFISGLGGFNEAMATRGGVDLNEVNLKSFEAKGYPGLFIIGEALDIDGDTGGYNLQFAFSSGHCAANI